MTYDNDHILKNREAFEAAYDKAKEELTKIPGVLGIGMGQKQKAGGYPGDLAIIVYVREKKASAQVPPDQRIPPTFEGYLTDVVSLPPAVPLACDNTQCYSTIQGGIQIETGRQVSPTAISVSQGTLGCIVRTRGDSSRTNVRLLSNEHVLFNPAGAGDYVHHPSLSDSGLGPIEALSFRQNINYTPPGGKADSFHIDCGTARINVDSECCWSVCTKDTVSYSSPNTVVDLNLNGSNEITDVRSLIREVTFAGQRVYKVGRTTRKTAGIVRDVAASLPIAGGKADNMLRIEFDPASTDDHVNCVGRASFAEEGDSGAVVVDEQRRIVGLLCLGPPADSTFPNPPTIADLYSGACHIWPVLDNLNVCVPTAGGTGHGSCGATDGSGISKSGGSGGGSGGSGGGKARSMLEDPPSAIEGGPPAPAFDPVAEQARLDRIRSSFCATRKGREMHDAVDFLKREVGFLVNHCRPVTVTWQRFRGPAFIAHFIRHLREGTERVPKVVDGVTLETLIERMRDVLRKHGSNPLKAAIDRFEHDVFELLSAGDSVDAYVAHLHARDGT